MQLNLYLQLSMRINNHEMLCLNTFVSLRAGQLLINTVLDTVFGRHVKVRMRAGFFPFVEPGTEVSRAATRPPVHDSAVAMWKPRSRQRSSPSSSTLRPSGASSKRPGSAATSPTSSNSARGRSGASHRTKPRVRAVRCPSTCQHRRNSRSERASARPPPAGRAPPRGEAAVNRRRRLHLLGDVNHIPHQRIDRVPPALQ